MIPLFCFRVTFAVLRFQLCGQYAPVLIFMPVLLRLMKNTRIGTRDEEQEGESFQGKLGARQGKRYPALKKARGGKATGGI
jgi:hypothetical protein